MPRHLLGSYRHVDRAMFCAWLLLQHAHVGTQGGVRPLQPNRQSVPYQHVDMHQPCRRFRAYALGRFDVGSQNHLR